MSAVAEARRPSWRGRARAARWRRSAARRRRPSCSARRGCTPRGRARRRTWSRRSRSGGARRRPARAQTVARRRRRRPGRSRRGPPPGVSIERVRSSTAARTRTASGCVVLTTMPSRAGRWQAAGMPRMPSTWTRQVRQAPSGGRSGSLQSCGSGMPRRLTASSTVAPGSSSTGRSSTTSFMAGSLSRTSPLPAIAFRACVTRGGTIPAHRRTSR